MGSHRSELDVSLPQGWTKHLKSAVLHSMSLAATAMTLARGQVSRSRSTRQRLAAELDHIKTEVALLKEELAVKEYGNIVVIERFIRSMKSECTQSMLIPVSHRAMRRELIFYIALLNEHRPSQALEGRTPHEVYEGRRPANALPRLEPRSNWSLSGRCASPPARIRGSSGATFTLVVAYLESRKHLSIVELHRAA